MKEITPAEPRETLPTYTDDLPRPDAIAPQQVTPFCTPTKIACYIRRRKSSSGSSHISNLLPLVKHN